MAAHRRAWQVWLSMCIVLVVVGLAWVTDLLTFQKTVSESALTLALAVRDRIHSNLQFVLLEGLDIGANLLAADFGGLVDCSCPTLANQLDLAQHAAIQLHTYHTVRLLLVLAPVSTSCADNNLGLNVASSGTVPSCAAAIIAAGSAHATCNHPGGFVATFCPQSCGLCNAPTVNVSTKSGVVLVLVGDAQLGSITISRSQVFIGDPAADTLTAFPLRADGSIDREQPELVLASGLSQWIAQMSLARGWRASLAGGGWQWGDLAADESGAITQPLYQSVCS